MVRLATTIKINLAGCFMIPRTRSVQQRFGKSVVERPVVTSSESSLTKSLAWSQICERTTNRISFGAIVLFPWRLEFFIRSSMRPCQGVFFRERWNFRAESPLGPATTKTCRTISGPSLPTGSQALSCGVGMPFTLIKQVLWTGKHSPRVPRISVQLRSGSETSIANSFETQAIKCSLSRIYPFLGLLMVSLSMPSTASSLMDVLIAHFIGTFRS